VNVMNREIEALEGIRRERQLDEEARQESETRHEHARQEALVDIQRQLQASTHAIHEGNDAITKHRELLEDLNPIISDIARQIEREFEQLVLAGPSPDSEQSLRFPGELREETMPEWLELVETALGRFRDLLPAHPGDKDTAFPCTANSSVRALQIKRSGGQHQTQPLVKQQELPSTILAHPVDEANNPLGKRGHTPLTAAQKAELLDDESEEEDFDHRPLKLKDLRARAEQAATRRKRRGHNQKREAFALSTGTPSARHGSSSKDGVVDGAEGIATKASHTGTRPATTDEEIMEDGSAASSGMEKGRASVLSDPTRDKGSSASSDCDKGVSSGQASRKLGRGKLAHQVEDNDTPEFSQEEIERFFLQRYKMTREELQVMADHMQIHIHNLCFLKQEFDQYDKDQSGYVDTRELKSILKGLGEDLSDEALDNAFKQLDSDGSGEIEFFEFAEWFTSNDS